MFSFKALPLEKFSNLHRLPLLNLIGIKSQSSFGAIPIVINFNLQTPIKKNSQALMTLHLRDASEKPSVESVDFCINHLTRWRLNLNGYKSFMGYLQKLNRKHYNRYSETTKAFTSHGASLSFIEDDWSEYAEKAYQLYTKVADKHGTRLYDLNFFREIAKNKDYKLMCVWLDKKLIAILVIVDETPVYHSMCCGLDYEDSKKTQAYSYMHFEFIRQAIEANKYTMADIGPTANEAKSMLGFTPINACMDVWAHNILIKGILRTLSRFVTATINSKARLELKFHFSKDKDQP